MAGPSDIDRLIELGLNRYGAGDLDGALLVWEEALAIDPDNEQAASYVDYVRLNYELLTSGAPSVEDDPGFGIEEEPEYQIEIEVNPPSALPLAAQTISLDPVDTGWDLEETYDASPSHDAQHDEDEEPLSLELEADEPPPADFEDATREYRPRDFEVNEHSGFHNSPDTPVGFLTEETNVRKRDLGFVQPSGQIELGQFEATQERNRSDTNFTDDDAAGEFSDDLIGSLPRPRPSDSAEIELTPSRLTRDMPDAARQPARRDTSAHSQAEVMLSHAPTRDLSPDEVVRPSVTDLEDLRATNPMISAPTRELGLRPGGRPLANPTDDDAPTGQTDVRAIRAAAARNDGGMPRAASEGTRTDIVLPFDPIAAASTQILADVDAEIPPDENKDEQTRRRITLLLERASTWTQAGDLDKAVAAVDLAMSEDPNSALGQKLITRNKDTIMSLFQAFLGDLERMPQLAKPLHELSNAPISPRAAFLLSRIDGTLTIDELLDVSGMPRLEAYRHLCQLYLRGILR